MQLGNQFQQFLQVCNLHIIMSSFIEANMAFFVTFVSKHFEIGFNSTWLLRICQHGEDQKLFKFTNMNSILYKNDNCQCLKRVLPGNYFMSKSMLRVTQYNITGLKEQLSSWESQFFISSWFSYINFRNIGNRKIG